MVSAKIAKTEKEEPMLEQEAKKIAESVVREVCELSDRSSPDDWPEAMLVTGEELHAIVVQVLVAGEKR
jgi:hypothetical protein